MGAWLTKNENGGYSFNWNNIRKDIGLTVNDLTGVTQQQDFQIQYLRDYYTNLVNSMSQGGFNAAAMLSGSGASPNSPGPISTANHYGEILSIIPGLLSSAANYKRATADYIAKDRYNKHLDWKEKEDAEDFVERIENTLTGVTKTITGRRHNFKR